MTVHRQVRHMLPWNSCMKKKVWNLSDWKEAKIMWPLEDQLWQKCQTWFTVKTWNLHLLHIFSWYVIILNSPVGMYRKRYCTNPGICSDVGFSSGAGVSKILKFNFEVLYDQQSTIRWAMSYVDRSCCLPPFWRRVKGHSSWLFMVPYFHTSEP